ncbi:lipoate--protein ligase family protein [Acidihalobacter ferrooxydans]|uniref:BPL/LPL catalytic domain-containing protein n=1 Tax=Acidihalobacter ferrooxydans TaxID=1765967 RepID=A0A1P8UG78_9GAMM|nr:lipoate--protein ligase family protein [Acidihalobacter ferrooxydans]APZ42771.1 hypothetical protein BW247_06410 [Acidihalobacter ferrooxydans]
MSAAVELRLLDVGRVTPEYLHAAYTGLAECLPRDADYGWLLTARSQRGHIALGASQYADAELDIQACRDAGIPVIQRRLGGGTVWVDDAQLCVFFILPGAGARAAFFSRCLDVLCAMFAGIGLAVERVGEQDIWARGAKLLGSGGATIGAAQVFGASILERFNTHQFAACVAAPSAGYRRWLAELLDEQMTDLQRLGIEADEARLRCALRAACADHWRVTRAQALDASETAAVAGAYEELAEPLESGGKRLVCNGIKINRQTYLFEDAGPNWLRVVWRANALVRVAAEQSAAAAVLERCLGKVLREGLVAGEARAQGFSGDAARRLERRVLQLCRDAGK